MAEVYLTIDDGPSEKFETFVDFLHERKIPAVFFNRGDFMEARPEVVLYGISKGFIMANHTYSHRRASKLTHEAMAEEISRTDQILDDLYAQSGVTRPGKYFRFPYMDRGMGPYFCEPHEMKDEYKDAHFELLSGGLGHEPVVPGMCEIDRKRGIQKILSGQGYEPLLTPGVTLPWYSQSEIGRGIDSLCTFSTSDWALLDRHKGKHGFSTLDDLKKKIDNDDYLKDKSSRHIVLAHEQAEIHDVTTALIDHMLDRNFKFMDFN